MRKLLLASIFFFASFAGASPAQATTPACHCTASSVASALTPELPCLQVIEQMLDVCYGYDAVIEVTNSCSFDVVVKSVPDFENGGTVDLTIGAGATASWQEAFSPQLSHEGDTAASMSWTVQADGTTHTMNLSFEGRCISTEDSGCQTSSGGTGQGIIFLALLCLLVQRHRSPGRL
jgi:hypothetical protein